MDPVLIHRFEVSVICRPYYGVCDVLYDYLGDPLCDPFLDANFCEEEDILLIVSVLGVTIVCDLWLDGAVVGADKIGGRS